MTRKVFNAIYNTVDSKTTGELLDIVDNRLNEFSDEQKWMIAVVLSKRKVEFSLDGFPSDFDYDSLYYYDTEGHFEPAYLILAGTCLLVVLVICLGLHDDFSMMVRVSAIAAAAIVYCLKKCWKEEKVRIDEDCTGVKSEYATRFVESQNNNEYLNSMDQGGGLETLGLKANTPMDIVIPDGVTKIVRSAFMYYHRERLTSIKIPDSVTEIEYGAFKGCTCLKQPIFNRHLFAYLPSSYQGEYSIPEGIRSIAEEAFRDCKSLTSIKIPDSVTEIEYGTFKGCTCLKQPIFNRHLFARLPSSYQGEYSIPEGIRSIACGAFEGCTGLTTIEIPNSVTEIGCQVFKDCTDLTSIEIPDSVTKIGYQAFKDCTDLTSIEIPDSVTEIGCQAFKDCTCLKQPIFNRHLFARLPSSYQGEYSIPEGIRSIADGAFEGCTGLTSIKISDSVTEIGCRAFMDCTGLTSIKIPDSVTEIGGWAFMNCTGLTSIKIPNSVTEIEWNAFLGCTGLTSIEIPNSVTEIGMFSFSDCTGLTTIEIPNSVTKIGCGAFLDCTGLTTIKIPNSVTYIENLAFKGCTSLTTIEIPNSVTYIGDHAFLYCFSLKSVPIPAGVSMTISALNSSNDIG